MEASRSVYLCGNYYRADTKRVTIKGRKGEGGVTGKTAGRAPAASILGPSVVDTSIGELPHLICFKLLETNVTTLPEEVGRLQELRHLEVRHNRNFRSLPEALCNCEALEKLYVSYTQLDTLPLKLSLSLLVVDLRANAFKEMPEALCLCTSLRSLSIADNCISFLPEKLGCLIALQELDVSRNDINQLPQSLTEGCLKLQRIKLDDNKLKSLPEGFAALQELRHLSVKNNELECTPPSVLRLAKLQTLDLRENFIKYVDVWALRGLKRLQRIRYEGNLLVDPIFGAEPRTAQTTVRFNPDGIDLYNSIKAKYKIGDTPETVVHANVVQTGQAIYDEHNAIIHGFVQQAWSYRLAKEFCDTQKSAERMNDLTNVLHHKSLLKGRYGLNEASFSKRQAGAPLGIAT